MSFPVESPAFQLLLDRLDLAATTAWPILLLGETGVGKERLARRIHDKSPRAREAFVPVNCGAIAPGIFESELFGHERGAFSGAVAASKGLVRLAHRGTLFLDELGDLSPDLQVKLLRFLDSGELRSVGGLRIERVEVRIVAATNRDLHAAVAEGLFRQDLLERLQVLTFAVPPLRERLGEIEGIARTLLEELGVRYDERCLLALREFDWPGNIRQLRNVLIRAAIFGRPFIRPGDLGRILDEEARRSYVPGAVAGDSASRKLSLADIERRVILERLKICRGNRKQAAKELGIAKSTLHEKLRKWNESDLALSSAGFDSQ